MIQSNLTKPGYWAIPLDPKSDSTWNGFLESVCQLYAIGVQLNSDGLSTIQEVNMKPIHSNNTNQNRGDIVNTNMNELLLELIKSNENISNNALNANREILALISGNGSLPKNDLDRSHESRTVENNTHTLINNNQQPIKLHSTDTHEIVKQEKQEKQTLAETSTQPTNTQPITLSNFNTATRDAICTIIKKHSGFEDEHLIDNANLQEDLGIDSIQQMLIVSDINKELGIDLMTAISWDEPPSELQDLYRLVDSIA
jgi:acyl carrier protein